MNRADFNIVVFSQSTPVSQIASLIQQCGNTLPFLCVSTHKLFDLEEAAISDCVQRPVRFACFGDFLTDEEMAWCDTHAYEIESIPATLEQYYRYIKVQKNKTTLKNIRREYRLAEKQLCAHDLGIAADVWLEEGFTNSVRQEQQTAEAPPGATAPPANRRRFSRLLKNFRRILRSLNWPLGKVFLLQTPFGNHIFLGSITRIQPHLDSVSIQRLQPGLIVRLVNLLLIFIPKRHSQFRKTILSHLQGKTISKHASAERVSTLLSTMHEYVAGYGELADSLNMDLVIVQDGFLPENYSSRYLAFYFGVREFWVWDRLSLGLFENQQFKAEVCPFLSVPKMPVIEEDQYSVENIVVLTSSAGDWTALKNRSDEDQMVIAFVKVAERFPDIQIIYRCHPLWAHPEHQGINSIHRVDRYLREKGLKNIVVSSESLVQSQQFIERRELGFPRSSLEQDLQRADLVFGEHSFTMIEAARRGKLFASVNLSNRRDFFHSYSKLGFPHLVSTGEIISFIDQLRVSPVQILERYNAAVNRYNTKWSR